MNILIHSERSGMQWQQLMEHYFPKADIRRWNTELPDTWQADYAVVWKPPAELFLHQKKLKAVLNLGAGVDSLLSMPEIPESLPIMRLKDAGMVEHMMDYIHYGLLHYYRDFDRYSNQQNNSHWQTYKLDSKHAWPITVLGLGALGSQVASSIAAMGFPVSGWSRTAKHIDLIQCFHGMDQLSTALSDCRVLINLLPSTSVTRGMLTTERLNLLMPGAVFINPGRGDITAEQDLLMLLDNNQLRGAMLDVFTTEPLPAENRLWCHPRVIVTPHVAAETPKDKAGDQIAETIRQFEAGVSPEFVSRAHGY